MYLLKYNIMLIFGEIILINQSCYDPTTSYYYSQPSYQYELHTLTIRYSYDL